MNRLAVDFDAKFIDDNDRKGSISDPGIVAEPARKFLAMLDCISGRRKFEAPSISDWYAVLHIKVESSHRVPAANRPEEWEGEPRCPLEPMPSRFHPIAKITDRRK
jgi:hypothetical protein